MAAACAWRARILRPRAARKPCKARRHGASEERNRRMKLAACSRSDDRGCRGAARSPAARATARTRARSSIRSSRARSSPASTTRLRSRSCSDRPTFTGQFTPNDWYYVSRDTNQFAFRNPRVTKQTVLLVRFDQAGNVASVQETGKELVDERRSVEAQHADARPQAGASSTSCSAISARSVRPGLSGGGSNVAERARFLAAAAFRLSRRA